MPRGKKKQPAEKVEILEPDEIIPPKKRAARKFYSPELADLICEEIAKGGALHKLCEERADFPAESAVYKWLEEHDEFKEKYARARERQAERRAEEIILIADTEKDAAIARNRIDARKWAAAKLLPKKYGDRILAEVTGANGGAIKLEAQRSVVLENLDDESLAQVEQALRLMLNKPE